MNIILVGPPGAGKGTQGNKIVKKFNLHKVSTGDLLRDEIRKDTNIGKKIKLLIDKGSFVSDEIINDLIEKIISNKKFNNRLIFDGYPRNLNQAFSLKKIFDKYNQKISIVISLQVDKNTIIKRILGRQICEKCGKIFNLYFNPSSNESHSCGEDFLKTRSDDNEKTIKNRYETYLNKTLPIIDYYKKQNILHEIIT